MNLPLAASSAEGQSSPRPWVLLNRALTLYYGCPEMPRLSHYFLPRVLHEEKKILYLDGGNQISPLLIPPFARVRGLDPSLLNCVVLVSGALNWLQLTQLIRRVPKFLQTLPASLLLLTLLPA